MTKTGKQLTREQIEEVKAAMRTPLVALNAGMPQSPAKLVHQYALAHGLPEIRGYYGADLVTGEILAP